MKHNIEGSVLPVKQKVAGIAFYFPLAASVILFFVTLCRWYIVDVITVFLEPFLELGVWTLFGICFLVSIVYIVSNYRYMRFRALIPAIVQILTFLILWYVPVTEITLKFDFETNLSERDAVVKMVQADRLEPNEYGLIKLPSQYKHLSKGGGEIVVDKQGGRTIILFYSFRGILDNFSGWVYTSDGEPPDKVDNYSDVFEMERLTSHWYWISSR